MSVQSSRKLRNRKRRLAKRKNRKSTVFERVQCPLTLLQHVLGVESIAFDYKMTYEAQFTLFNATFRERGDGLRNVCKNAARRCLDEVFGYMQDSSGFFSQRVATISSTGSGTSEKFIADQLAADDKNLPQDNNTSSSTQATRYQPPTVDKSVSTNDVEIENLQDIRKSIENEHIAQFGEDSPMLKNLDAVVRLVGKRKYGAIGSCSERSFSMLIHAIWRSDIHDVP